MTNIIDPDEIRAAASGTMYEDEFNNLADEIERLQARIDALMLEHCPDEIKPEQAANWERHQVAAPNNIDMANQIAAAAECLDELTDIHSPAARAEAVQNITNLRRIAQELSGSRGGELYPLPVPCDEA